LGTQDQREKISHDFFYREDRHFQGKEPSLRYRFNLSESHAELPDQPGKGFGYRVKSTLVSYLKKNGWYYFGDYKASYGFKFGGSILTPWTRLAHSQKMKADFNVPFADRYFLGGAKSLRGYSEEEISGVNGQGGESLWSGGLELFYPMHSWMDGSIFYEMGRLYEGNLDIPLEDLSHSIGLGILIRTPVGPIQGYFAHPLGEDRIGRLGLQLGTIF
jgi:outer membrane protein assembly factor BamA